MTEVGERLVADLKLLYKGVPLILGIPEEVVERVEKAAVEEERKRIHKEIHVSLNSMPIFAHVNAYGLGQVLKGNPWPEDA
jgi:hypothetical protein